MTTHPCKTARGWTGRLATISFLAFAASAGAQGFPNIARTPGTLINGPIAPQQGRTAIVAWHGQRIVSVPEPPGSQAGADLNIRIVDINNPAAPIITQVPSQAGGFNSHGYFHSGTHLYLGYHCIGSTLAACNGGANDRWRDSYAIGGVGPFFANSNLRPANVEDDLGLPVSTYNRSGAHSPWGAEMYWSYGDVGGNAWLAVRRSLAQWTHDWNNGGAPTGPAVRASWDHLGQTGVVGMPFIFGNLLIYASDQTGSGVAVYDISNPSSPQLLDVLKDENPGGYWPEIYGHYIFFPRRDGDGGTGSTAGYMVVDFEDPTNLRVVAERNVPGSNQYVTFQDDYAFMNKYKIDMRTFDVVLTLPTNDTTLDASQFALPLGNLVVTGGYGTLGPGLAIWAHQAEPDVRPPFVAYHLPRPDQTNYSVECPISISLPETLKTETIVNGTTLIVRPVGGSPIPIWHSFSQGKVLTVTPRSVLAANTTYEVLLTSGIQDAAGNGMEPYSWRFSTGGSVSGGNQPPAIGAITSTPNTVAPNVSTTLAWSGSDPEGLPLEYRVDFGDGTPRTNWNTATSVAKTYTSEGHYQITVQARDPQGSVVARSRTITVATPPTQTASTSSSHLALDAAASRLFVVNPDNDTVSAINTATNAKVWEAPTAADPRGIAQGSDGSLWVVCRDADAIDVLNASTGALIQRLPLNYGAQPTAIAPLPNRTAMLVSCEGDGTLRRFLVSGRTQNASLAVGPTPRAIAINHAGTRALVTRFISGPDTGSVYDVAIGAGLTLTRTIGLVRDRSTDGPASSRGVPNYLAGVTIHPGGQYAWVVGKKDNTTRGTFMSPALPLESDITVRAQLMLVDLTTNAEAVAHRLDIDNSESPTSVAFSPLGDYAFITLQGNAQLAVIDVLDFFDVNSPGTVRTRWGTGIAPQSVVIDGATGRLYTHDFMDRRVTSFDAQAFITQGSGNVPATTIATVGAERLQPTVLAGKRIFYHASDPRMSAEGYISCATCHVEGGHDGRTWDFTDRGEGFRNTTDLRGRSGMGHGLVHWSANFDEIQDFENDIRNAFGGTGFLTNAQFASVSNTLGAPKAGLNADLDALAAYVTSLGSSTFPRSPYRNADGTLTASALNGQTLFNSNNCASCHVPTADYTDRARRDVGTVRASSGQRLGASLNGQIDTPTLVGLHASAPYFHDGSATTLEDVFTITGGRLSQAETGTLGGGAYTDTINWFAMKEWQSGTFVDMNAGSGTLTFSDVTSTSAGAGIVEVRYNTSYGPATLGVTVNGTTTTVTINETPNEPMWLPNEWRIVRANVNFNAGTNTVRLQRNGGWGGVKIDSVLFSTPQDRVRAAAHVRNFTPTQVADMVAYLRSLDATNAATPTVALQRGVATIGNGATDTVVPAGGGAMTLVYRISNSGLGPLNLGQFRVTAPGAIGATIQRHPAPTVAAGGFTELELRIATPTAPFTATLTGWMDSPSTNQLSWTVQATVPTPAVSNSFVVR